ncbi:MAG: polysaccharide biosynthesis tyrosine autokinase [Candidatus Omnitrophica bacterium]|nr:polysaccharide biosynthesis tyrosine autokinase [Candidatus Omnitrophota bacterium]
MTTSSKSRKLTVKEDIKIVFCRHVAAIGIITISFGAFAFFLQRNVLIYGAMGFAFSIALGYLLRSLDSTIKTSEDIESCANMPCLGNISLIKKEFKDKNDNSSTSYQRNYSYVSEDFKKAETLILNSYSGEEPLKTFVISSFIPKEGKSFMATNIAIAFANSGEETLLIDGDMRKGSLNKIFNIDRDKGLSNALAGASLFHEVVVPTEVDNLSLLPLGAVSPNPIKLLKGSKIKDILSEARTKFKKIIIDTSPVLSVTDALFFGSECDGLVFVAKAGVTSFQHITEAKQMIEGKVNILGALLNGVESKKGKH